MRTVVSLVVLVGLAAPGWARDDVLAVVGKGAEGKPKHRGGKVQFLDVSLADQVVHLADARRIPLRLSIRYKVLETAPVVLNTRFGSEFWRFMHYATGQPSALHTHECIDLSKRGEATTSVAEARVARRRPDLAKGLVGIRGHHNFLIDRPSGRWIDVVGSPGFLSRPETARKLAFTLANLTRFKAAVGAIESTWTPGGPVRVKLTVTDADGQTFPVVNARASIAAGGRRAALATEMDATGRPSGWMSASLPVGAAPERVTVEAAISAMTPKGPTLRKCSRSFARGEGRKTAAELSQAAGAVTLAPGPDGVVRETRALWVHGKAIMTREGIDSVVDRAARAGLNVLVPSVFSRSTLLVASKLHPMSVKIEKGLDPIRTMIGKAHARGLEVHPWFCVAYRDRRFVKRHPGVEMIDAKGEVEPLVADLHRPQYRDFIVELMVGVARDYPVDGIHLDYIRTKGQCYCKACRAEFARQFGKALTDATPDDWLRWQRQAVGDIVRRTAEGVRKVRPKAIVSAAVFSGLAAGAAQGQDPAGWAKHGWIDVVMPMDYKADTLEVRACEQAFLDLLDDDARLVTGLALFVRSGGKVSARTPALVRSQIQLVRRMGIRGYCLFVDKHLTDDMVKMLRTEVNAQKAAPAFRAAR